MHANLPEIAQRWERDYASGGIARLGYQQGNWVAPLYNTNVMQGNVIPADMGIYNYQYPMGTNIYGMDEMFAYPGMQQNNMISNMEKIKPVALDILKGKYKYGVGPDGKPYQEPRSIADQKKYLGQTFTKRQQPWYNRMFNKVGEGITGLMDNTMLGRFAAGFDATNPRAFNYNPLLQGQIDLLKSQGKYGVMDPSGLNKITRGVLKGKNLQSMLGSNDLTKMYDKSIAQTEKTLADLLEADEEGNIGYGGKWSNLAKTNPAAFAKKVALHKARLQQKKDEAKTFRDDQDKIRKEKEARNLAKATHQQRQTMSARGGEGGSGGRFVDRKTGAMKGYEQGAGGGKDAADKHFYIARGGVAQRAPRYANGGIASLWPK